MEDKSSDRHAHAARHLHLGIAMRFVMFTDGGTDAYGCTSTRSHICHFIRKKCFSVLYSDLDIIASDLEFFSVKLFVQMSVYVKVQSLINTFISY